VAVNPAGTFAYVANFGSNTLSVIDTSTNMVTTTIAVGGSPVGVAINPTGTLAYVANQGGSYVSVIDLSTNTVTTGITIGPNPEYVAVNPAGTFAYVTSYVLSTVTVIDTSTNTVITSIPVGTGPEGVTVNPAGTFAYVADILANEVSVIEMATNTVVDTIPVGANPLGVAVNPAGTFAYVTNAGSDYASVIDLSTNVVMSTMPVGSYPAGVAVSRAGTYAYVVNQNDGTVSVLDAPGTPGQPTATAGDTEATVTVVAPTTGWQPDSYAVTATDATAVANGGQTCTVIGASGSCSVSGLTGGDNYTFSATATNTFGTSSASARSAAVTVLPDAPGTPGAPTAVHGDGQATVAVSPPTSGGRPTSYTVTSIDSTDAANGGQTCTVTGASGSCTITGLTNGNSYTFVTTATNAGGTSSSSAPSNAVTPAVPVSSATRVSVSRSSVSYGDEGGEAFTVTVTGAGSTPPTGTVTIKHGTVALCSTTTLTPKAADAVAATCGLSKLQLAAGSYSVTASYSGDDNYTASTSTAATFSVTKDSATITMSESPAEVSVGEESQAVFTTSVATGNGEAVSNGTTVIVHVGSATCTVALAGGTGTCTIADSALQAGSYTVTASFSGDADLDASTLTSSTVLTVSSGTSLPVSPTGEPWSAPLYWWLAGAMALAGFALVELGRRRFRSTS
jgi:YVTN family beta-propeller protein